jgi:hypothetical protein
VARPAWASVCERTFRALEIAPHSSSMVPEPNIIAKRILKIAEIRNPRSRYLIGTDTRLVNLLNKYLPLCLLEVIKARLFRINRVQPVLTNTH